MEVNYGSLGTVKAGCNVSSWKRYNDCDPFVHTIQAIQHKIVDVLMNPKQNSKDIDLVKDIFEDRDAHLILYTIQILTHGSVNMTSWVTIR